MMNGYQHLGFDERRDIYRMVATGRSVRQIADALGRVDKVDSQSA